MEDSSQSREQRVSLLLHGRKIAADAAKSGDLDCTAKGARNLLLNFRSAKVLLGLVVVKWDRKIIQKGQHLLDSTQ